MRTLLVIFLFAFPAFSACNPENQTCGGVTQCLTGTATAPGNSLTGRTMQLTFNCSGNAALNSSTGGMECLMVAAGAFPGGGMTTAVTVNSAALNTTAAIPMTTRVTWGTGTTGNYVMGRQINVLGIPY
jgi:hypothetical protein